MSKLFQKLSQLQEAQQEKTRQESAPLSLKTLPPREGASSRRSEPLGFFVLGLFSGILLSGLTAYMWVSSLEDNKMAFSPEYFSSSPATVTELPPAKIPQGITLPTVVTASSPTAMPAKPLEPATRNEDVITLAKAKEEPLTPTKQKLQVAATAVEPKHPMQATDQPLAVASPTKTTIPVSKTPGKYPQASERLLTKTDLSGISKTELKLMRNEIFARHSYVFQSTKMTDYFEEQGWYSAKHKNVNTMLTETERLNIELILRAEK